jgi:hypothetical protein
VRNRSGGEERGCMSNRSGGEERGCMSNRSGGEERGCMSALYQTNFYHVSVTAPIQKMWRLISIIQHTNIFRADAMLSFSTFLNNYFNECCVIFKYLPPHKSSEPTQNGLASLPVQTFARPRVLYVRHFNRYQDTEISGVMLFILNSTRVTQLLLFSRHKRPALHHLHCVYVSAYPTVRRSTYLPISRIWGYHGGEYEDSCLMDCSAV